MINWKLRLKNKITLIALIGAVLSLIYTVLGIFKIVPPVSQEELFDMGKTVVSILVILGVVVDPTTEGIGDSDRALGYEEPARRDSAPDEDEEV